MLFLSCLVLAVISRLASVQANASYIVVAPKILRPGSSYDVSVTILQATGDVTVSVRMLCPADRSITQKEATLSKGQTSIVSLQAPDIATLVHRACSVDVRGSGGLIFNGSHSLDVKTKTMSMFVQTDKSMYKPGQKVLFRVIAVQPDLKPYTQALNIYVADDAGNKIAQWLNVKNDTGVFTNSVQLSDQPPLGTWSIKVTAQENEATKTFDVAHYVLPKFEVTVDLPSYYLLLLNKRSSQQDLHATISAKYTYGQPVKGTATVKIDIKSYRYWHMTNEDKDQQPKYKLMTVPLKDGVAQVSVSIAEILAMVDVPDFYIQRNMSYDRWQMLSNRQIIVVANVTETVTGKVLSGNGTVRCTQDKYRLSFLDITPTSFKPGLAVHAYMQLKQNDGRPPSIDDIRSQSVVVTASLYSKFSQSREQTIAVAIPESGLMTFSFVVDESDNCTRISMSAVFNDTSSDKVVTSDHKSLTKFSSRDDEGIQVTLDNSDGQIESGETAMFTVKTTSNVASFTYQLLSKGIIVKSATVTGAPATSRQLSIPINSQLAQKLAPSAKLVVWFITSGSGEIVSDSLEFTVTGAFANEVSVSFDKKTVQPSDGVTVDVTAHRNSFVGLLAVDQSVLLLKSGNDITQGEVLKDLSSYETSSRRGGRHPWADAIDKRKRRDIAYCWPYFIGGTDSSEVFDNAGVIVMTDAYVHKEPVIYPMYSMRAEADLLPAGMVLDSVGTSAGERSIDSSDPVRMNFPETWLWTDLTTGADGRATLKATVPDTITSWVLSAFAMSPEVGLGIDPEAAKLTVFKPSFVSLDLPYSIKRGEEFALRVIVFNYLATVTVKVTLFKSEYFAVRTANDIVPQNQTVNNQIKVEANDAASVYFWIVPYTVGHIPIVVRAEFDSKSVDTVKAMLLVEPEGVRQEYTTSVFFSQSTSQTSNATLNISLPSDGTLVPGSEYFEVTAIGDLLGQSLNGLGNLLQMPYGCGEQNMLTFAPDVYVLKYLHITGQAKQSIVDDAHTFINAGYQRELTYQRTDGSFSAFGNSDPSGSVWLSAFVVKCFHEARDYVPVDDEKIAPTLDWLLENMAPNGSFSEPPNGRVIHTDMQGGSAKGVALTAYVLIALLENKDNTQQLFDRRTMTVAHTSRLMTSTESAVRYLQSQLPSVASDPYALSIITYALTLANSASSATALWNLNALAINKDGRKYWSKSSDDDDDDDDDDDTWRPPYQRARSVDIEMTSYALLTYAKLKDFNGGIPIAKWIVSQRNSLGGFSSTQDTVMALQALAEFAALTSDNAGKQNLMLSVEAGTVSHQFATILHDNALVLQSVKIPSTANEVVVLAKGTGVGLVQLNVKYSVHGQDAKKRRKRDVSRNSDIELDVDHEQTDDKHISLRVCASWKGSKPSGMSIIEVERPTGFVVEDVDQIQRQSPLIRRVDDTVAGISLYLDELTKTALCVRMTLVKVKLVSNVQPASVSAYRYYEPRQHDTVVYQPTATKMSLCDQCPECCRGHTSSVAGSRMGYSVLVSSLVMSTLIVLFSQ